MEAVMTHFNILGLVGGISKNSLNKKLFKAAQDLAPDNLKLTDFDISRLPFFNQDIENDPPQSVNELRTAIKESDAILLVTPEYNRSVPGVLKNAIDWGSRPYGHSVWDQKITAVMGASVGNIGTFGAQHHLRQTLAYLNTKTMGQPEFYLNASKAFDDDGKLKDPAIKELIEKYMHSFTRWIELFRLLKC